MPIMEWNESFVNGVELFDCHHQHLVMLLNCAHDNFVANSSLAAMARVLDEIIHYTDHHFCVEEHWMRKIDYPGFDEHLQQHGSFAKRALVMQRDLAEGRKNIPLEILAFLKNWLTFHISDDAEYALFMAGSQWKLCA